MRSEAVHNITGARALQLIQGAALWRAYLNARGDSKTERARLKWRRWLDSFEPRLMRQNAVYHAVTNIVDVAYRGSLNLAATDPGED